MIDDGMEKLLPEAEHADGLILASPVNAGTIIVLMKRFIDRLICYTWWPWGAAAPSVMARLGGSAKALAARSEHQRIGKRVVQKVHRLGADFVRHS